MNVPRTLKLPLALFVLALVVTALVYQFPVSSVLDVGSGREEPFIHGFSFRENLPDGINARWSNGHSEIQFVGIGAQDGTLTLRYAAPRPNGAARLTVTANGADHTPPRYRGRFSNLRNSHHPRRDWHRRRFKPHPRQRYVYVPPRYAAAGAVV